MRDCSKTVEAVLTVGGGSETINIVNVCQLAMIEAGFACDRCTGWRVLLKLVGFKSVPEVAADALAYFTQSQKGWSVCDCVLICGLLICASSRTWLRVTNLFDCYF
jgi:hypothetical protein